ncbi:MAG: hypothetical protein FWB84_07115 [Candidatus Bathyarchaeota archaeon]|uniref:hypothetical protein n=1 Tax=Candidatus Bathycorpusculum sp. TaxID=2994959 RepID=UPI002826C9FC|nr:hypothetical protein [Candidatus Termiticorpusculum sp.]MCL2257944.1 hypothetical protein [Candidatus Termiticorpusculum sp.]MCL2291909.1 hypothetical protein [Candidatus Termiticorpusculum sp.]
MPSHKQRKTNLPKKSQKQQEEKQILDFGDTHLLNTYIQTHYQKQFLEIFQEKPQP